MDNQAAQQQEADAQNQGIQSGNSLTGSFNSFQFTLQSSISNREFKRITSLLTEKQAFLESISDLLKKTCKNAIHFLSSLEQESESLSKNSSKSAKNLQQIMVNNSQGSGEFMNSVSTFANVLQELSIKSADAARLNNQIVNKMIGEHSETVVGHKKNLNDRVHFTIKQVNNILEKFNKQQSKYQKAQKEVESLTIDKQNAQEDIRLYYNLAYNAKQDIKMKKAIIISFREEEIQKKLCADFNTEIDNLPKVIADSFTCTKEIYKNTLIKIHETLNNLKMHQEKLFVVLGKYLESNKIKDVLDEEFDDSKLVLEKLLKRSQDVILQGVNFTPIQSALQRKEQLSEAQMRAYPESANQYLEVLEQILSERGVVIKGINKCLSDLGDYWSEYLGIIDQQSREIRKAISVKVNDEIAERLQEGLKEAIEDCEQNVIENTKTILNLLKSSIKVISSAANEQQAQSSGFFNMTKKLFADFQKYPDKKKWVIDTSQFLSISLSALQEHQLSRLKLIREQQKSIISAFLTFHKAQIQSKQSKQQITADVEKVFLSLSKQYDYNTHLSEMQQNHLEFIPNKLRLPPNFEAEHKDLFASIQNSNIEQENVIEEEISPETSVQIEKDQINEEQPNNSSIPPTKFSSLFGVKESEMPIVNYNCAFSHKILLQGKMYIFQDRVGFHSYFNSQSFVGDTALSVPFIDIIRVEKRKNAVIFDNSIAIVTLKGELFFTSYVARDQCLKQLTLALENSRKNSSVNLGSNDLEESNGNDKGEIQDADKNNDDKKKLDDIIKIEARLSDGILDSNADQERDRRHAVYFSSQDLQKNSSAEILENNLHTQNNKERQNELESQSPSETIKPKVLIFKENLAQSQEISQDNDKKQKDLSGQKEFPSSSSKNEEQKQLFLIPPLSQSASKNLTEPIEKQGQSEKNAILNQQSLSAQKSKSDQQEQQQPQQQDDNSLAKEEEEEKERQRLLQEQQLQAKKEAEKIEEENKKRAIARKNQFQQESLFFKGEQSTNFEQTFPSVHISEIFSLLFMENQTNGFIGKLMKEFQSDEEIVFSKLTPSPPSWFFSDTKAQQSEQPVHSTREYSFTHPVREKIPFGPKVSYCACSEKFYWISPDEFCIQKEVKLSKIPYADYFTVRSLFIVENIGQNTKVQYRTYVNFVKSTTFKGRIASGSIKENTEFWNELFIPQGKILINNYLKSSPNRHLRVKPKCVALPPIVIPSQNNKNQSINNSNIKPINSKDNQNTLNTAPQKEIILIKKEIQNIQDQSQVSLDASTVSTQAASVNNINILNQNEFTEIKDIQLQNERSMEQQNKPIQDLNDNSQIMNSQFEEQKFSQDVQDNSQVEQQQQEIVSEEIIQSVSSRSLSEQIQEQSEALAKMGEKLSKMQNTIEEQSQNFKILMIICGALFLVNFIKLFMK